MPAFVRKIFIFITGYAWLLALLGPGLIAMALWSQWKAEGDHAYTAREALQTVSGTVTGASEVTVKRKRRSTKHYYEITVAPATGGEARKLRIDYSTPQQLVGALIDEKVTALVDADDNDMVYDVVVDGTPVITYEATRDRLTAEATSSANNLSGAGTWVIAILITLIGAGGVWINRRLRAAQARAEEEAAAAHAAAA